MKDEEMAEEKIDKMADDFVNAQEFTKVYSLARKAECGAFWKKGFLAGLKAGRPQWHDLSEQIPTENKMYLIAIKDNGLAIAYFNGRNWETKYNLGDFGHWIETVIAWCEIPTFDKE